MQIKVVDPNSMNSHCIIRYCVLREKKPNSFKKEKLVSFTIVLNETVNTNLTKICPLSVTKWEVRIKYFHCIPKDDACLKEEHL